MSGAVSVCPDDIRQVVGVLSVALQGVPLLRQLPGVPEAVDAGERLMAAVTGQAMPPDPVSDAEGVAIGFRHVYESFMRADFDEEQAYGLTLAYAQSCYAQASMLSLRSASG
jgi:hypothetical protein